MHVHRKPPHMLICPTPRRLLLAMAFALCATTAATAGAADPKLLSKPAIDFANPDHLGNVYLTTEQVVLPVAVAQGDRIAWKISDLWGTQLAEGTSAVSGGITSITPPFAKKGYFLVEVTLPDHTTAYTSFAVITPPGPLSAESPFGVVGGGELLPVIAKAGISSIRVEHCWSGIEKEKGIFTYPAKWQRAMDDCKPFGINPVLSQYLGPSPVHRDLAIAAADTRGARSLRPLRPGTAQALRHPAQACGSLE